MSRNNHSGRTVTIVLLTILILIMIAATCGVIWLCLNLTTQQVEAETTQETVVALPTTEPVPTETETQPPETTEEPKNQVIATATIGSTGDLLMHKPIIDLGKKNGEYDFTNIFQYVAPYVSALDFAVANLETTLAGPTKPYMGNPTFNCPDAFIDNVKDTGFDLLLTANNHMYDTGTDGMHRTLQVVREKGLVALGSQDTEEEKKYVVQDVNGIQIGMICYTYNSNIATYGKLSLNGMRVQPQDYGLINHYNPHDLPAFYEEIQTQLDAMRADGAEATIVYLHWGPQEYHLKANKTQVDISQKLCDMGVDAIIGGHPHVVQNMDLLTSTQDENHKTVVLYSMGNAIANQRTGMTTLFPRGYTEDGILFMLTFEKYADGSVHLLDTNVLPTWVNLHGKHGVDRQFNIVPLDKDKEADWKELYGFEDDYLLNNALKSYDRTMGLVGEGLEKCKDYLTQAKLQRDPDYVAPTEAPTEPVTEPATEAAEETA